MGLPRSSDTSTQDYGIVILSFGRGPGGALALSLLADGISSDDLLVVQNPHPSEPPPDYPAQVTVLRRQHNDGYGAAMNDGLEYFRHRGAGTVVLLTHDVAVDGATCAALAQFRRAHQVAACAPVLLWPSGEVISAGGDLTRLMGVRHRGEWSPRPLAWLDGACLAVDPALRFREDLFMYWEDVALGLAVVDSGGGLAVAAALTAVTSPAPARSPESFRYYSWRNRLLVHRSHIFRLLLSALALIGTASIRAVSAPRASRRELASTYCLALTHGLRGMGGPRADAT